MVELRKKDIEDKIGLKRLKILKQMKAYNGPSADNLYQDVFDLLTCKPNGISEELLSKFEQIRVLVSSNDVVPDEIIEVFTRERWLDLSSQIFRGLGHDDCPTYQNAALELAWINRNIFSTDNNKIIEQILATDILNSLLDLFTRINSDQIIVEITEAISNLMINSPAVSQKLQEADIQKKIISKLKSLSSSESTTISSDVLSSIQCFCACFVNNNLNLNSDEVVTILPRCTSSWILLSKHLFCQAVMMCSRSAQTSSGDMLKGHRRSHSRT